MRDFNDINTYPQLLREMADDIEQCLEEENQGKLLGCLSAICYVFRFHIAPVVFAHNEALLKEVKKNENLAENN